MSTRVVMFEAAPTPWDVEGRFVGSRPLPLTQEAVASIQRRLDELLQDAINSVYRAAANEACDQVARMIAKKFNLRVRDNPGLDGLGLGHWEGLTLEDVKFRFPTIYKEWQDHPLAITPSDGEPLIDAIARVQDAIKSILRRNRDLCVALPLRPRVLQIALGVLRQETPETISTHLHQSEPMATIELDLAEYKTIIT